MALSVKKQRVDAAVTNVIDQMPSDIQKHCCQFLEFVDVGALYFTSKLSRAMCVHYLEHVKKLTIDSDCQWLFKHCVELHVLNLASCTQFAPAFLPMICANNQRTIRSVNTTYSEHILSTTDLEAIFNCPRLSCLSLAQAPSENENERVKEALLADLFEQFLQKDNCMLKRLDLDAFDSNETRLWPHIMKLRLVSLKLHWSDVLLSEKAVAWQTLRTLHIAIAPQSLHILNELKQLRRLLLTVWDVVHPEEDEPITTLSLPRLRSFHYVADSREYAINLHAPKLSSCSYHRMNCWPTLTSILTYSSAIECIDMGTPFTGRPKQTTLSSFLSMDRFQSMPRLTKFSKREFVLLSTDVSTFCGIMPNVSELDIGIQESSDSACFLMSRLPKLTNLTLHGYESADVTGYLASQSTCIHNSLSSLRLWDFTNPTTQLLFDNITYSQLTFLQLNNCRGISSFSAIARACAAIQTLWLSNVSISNTELVYIVSNTQLTNLSIRYLPNINWEFITTLSANSTNNYLKELEIQTENDVFLISNAIALINLIRSCPAIRYLYGPDQWTTSVDDLTILQPYRKIIHRHRYDNNGIVWSVLER